MFVTLSYKKIKGAFSVKTMLYCAQDFKTLIKHVGLDKLMDKAIDSLTKGMEDYKQASYEIPIRSGFEYENPFLGLVEWMPTLKCKEDIVLKVVGYHPSNPQHHLLPSVLSTSFILNTDTGSLSGIMDSTFTTAIRTGAASAVASRVLANPNSKVLGLIGAGAQAVTQLHALSRNFNFTDILVFDTDINISRSFSTRIESLNISGAVSVSDLDQLLSKSDIICTSTSVDIGKGPVFVDSTLKSDIHINAVGADFPGKVEIPHSLLSRAFVCPDFLQQAMHEGECQQLKQDQVGPELVELVQHYKRYQPYRSQASVFDSTGWAFEDYIMAKMLSDYASEFNLGQKIQLSTVSKDCKNPYDFLS